MRKTVRVHQTTWLADSVTRVEFRDPGGAELPAWRPGAHLTLHLPNQLAREYSLCGDPAQRDRWSVAVLRERASRGGSAWVHERLTPGALIEVEGPRENFTLEPAPAHLLIAGGIGITPLLPMANALAASDSDWSILYCGRSRGTMAFIDELSTVAGSRLRIHADDEQGGPPDLGAALTGLPPGALVYCCGPEPLITAVEATLDDRSALRVERFRAPTTVAPAAGEERGFDVVCSGSGTRVRVEPQVPVLDALASAGIDVANSCREGICGTCETKVLAGEPDHRDFLLTEEERATGATMMLCVSRCRSAELILDLD